MNLKLNYDFFLKRRRLVLKRTKATLEVKSSTNKTNNKSLEYILSEQSEIDNKKRLGIPLMPIIIEDELIEEKQDIKEEYEFEEIKPVQDDRKLVALTFDNAPSIYTSTLLDVLKQNGSTATFFVLGNNIKGNEEALKEIEKNGNEIGVLGYSHTPFTNLPLDDVAGEIAVTQNMLFDNGITPSQLVRPPFGKLNESIKENINSPFVLWNIDTEDWKDQNKESIKNKIRNNIIEGSIILMHEYPTSIDAIKEIIPELQEQGYSFTTINEINKRYDMKLLPGRVYAKLKSGS